MTRPRRRRSAEVIDIKERRNADIDARVRLAARKRLAEQSELKPQIRRLHEMIQIAVAEDRSLEMNLSRVDPNEHPKDAARRRAGMFLELAVLELNQEDEV